MVPQPPRLRAAIVLGAVVAVVLPSTATAQLDADARENPLGTLAFLVGTWSGELEGTFGPSTGRRVYRLVLDERFLFMTHDRDPSGNDDALEDSEEWGVLSFDAQRGVIMLREFLVEGLVNTYQCALEEGPTALTCESESADGAAALSMSLRYDFAGRDRFPEIFEVFGADGEKQLEIRGRWIRAS